MQMTSKSRMAVAFVALGAIAACVNQDAVAGASAFSTLASQTNQRFDQATSYVGQKVDDTAQSAKQNFDNAGSMPNISASGVAASARANVDNAASSTNAAIVNAASATGAGFQNAGHKLQQWSSRDGGASGSQATGQSSTQASGSGAATQPSGTPGNRTEFDK